MFNSSSQVISILLRCDLHLPLVLRVRACWTRMHVKCKARKVVILHNDFFSSLEPFKWNARQMVILAHPISMHGSYKNTNLNWKICIPYHVATVWLHCCCGAFVWRNLYLTLGRGTLWSLLIKRGGSSYLLLVQKLHFVH